MCVKHELRPLAHHLPLVSELTLSSPGYRWYYMREANMMMLVGALRNWLCVASQRTEEVVSGVYIRVLRE